MDVESVADRSNSGRSFSLPRRRIATGDLDLRRHQIVSGGSGRGIAVTRGLHHAHHETLRQRTAKPSARSQPPLRLLVECETDLQCHLPMTDCAVLDISAGFGYFKPPHIADGFLGPGKGIFDGFLKNALARAEKTVRNMRWFEEAETRGYIENGKISHWQVTLKIGFTLEDAQG